MDPEDPPFRQNDYLVETKLVKIDATDTIENLKIPFFVLLGRELWRACQEFESPLEANSLASLVKLWRACQRFIFNISDFSDPC